MKGARGRVHRSRKASKLAPKDYISTMPEEVITNILHCLPLHDIMKTSILSKDWRYKCSMITQLVFDEKFYNYLEKKKYEKDYEWIIDELLHLLTGAITKFVLYLPYIEVDVNKINDWIIYLSKKGIKEFAFKDANEEELELTPHLFSCLELTHLELDSCALRLPSEFGGFPKLLRLYLSNVTFIGYNGWEFLTRSPLVEILKLQFIDNQDKLKHVEIAKLENLKSLSLFIVENIFLVAGSLPKVQELTLHFWGYKILADAGNRVPIFLPCLKTLDLYDIDFRNGAEISCAIELICGSPNLETLSIQSVDMCDLQGVSEEEDDSSEVDFRRMVQLQLLRKVKLAGIRGLDSEICLIKYIVKRSPLLKKMDIYADSSAVGDLKGRRKFEKKLSKFLNRHSHRFRLVEIDIFWRYGTSSTTSLPVQQNQLLSAD